MLNIFFESHSILFICIIPVVSICAEWLVISPVWLFGTPVAPRFLCPCSFPGKNTRVGCHFLFQGSASQVSLVVKHPYANAGDIRDTGSVPGLGWSPGGGHGNPLQYSCLENSMDRGAWWATVHRFAKSQTQLKWQRTHSRGSSWLRNQTCVSCVSHIADGFFTCWATGEVPYV